MLRSWSSSIKNLMVILPDIGFILDMRSDTGQLTDVWLDVGEW